MTPINITLAVEGELDANLLRYILETTSRYVIDAVIGRKGKVYIQDVLPELNQTSQSGYPYCVLLDLDTEECAPTLLQQLLPHGKFPNLIFRIAVREIEAWLLADREGMAQFLSLQTNLVPPYPDTLSDPKRVLIDLAKQSPKRDIQNDIVPDANSTSKVGRAYNARLTEYILENWDVLEAQANSPSLKRAVEQLQGFQVTT